DRGRARRDRARKAPRPAGIRRGSADISSAAGIRGRTGRARDFGCGAGRVLLAPLRPETRGRGVGIRGPARRLRGLVRRRSPARTRALQLRLLRRVLPAAPRLAHGHRGCRDARTLSRPRLGRPAAAMMMAAVLLALAGSIPANLPWEKWFVSQ